MTPDFTTYVDRLWESGAGRHFTNLRSLKLFANKISYSLEIVGSEVNFEDFLTIEIIKDIHPPLYEQIYQLGPYFYNAEMAIETWGERIHPLDKERDLEARGKVYEELKNSVPPDKRYVFAMVANLFPSFAEYESRITWREPVEAGAERQRRIFHPRFFKQYFIFRAPPQLFSEKDFRAFVSSLSSASEEGVKKTFCDVFSSILSEEFKRWHFMHRIEMAFDDFGINAARGLSRGMASSSSHWSRDAFEFDIAIRCTYKTLIKIKASPDRQRFLRDVIADSASSLFMVYVIWVIETDDKVDKAVLPDVDAVKPFVRERMAARYLVADPPSVYDEFKSIDPNQVLFGWRRLGPDAEADQRKYLRLLLAANVDNLNKFLKLLFRPMMDDYSALRPVFDYDELAELIKANETKLDPEKVAEFWERYKRDKSSPPFLGEIES